MSVRIYLRIFGYVATLVMHISNIVYMSSFHQGEVMQDPKIRTFIGLQWRFITCWNFFFQIIYAFLGLACDWLVLENAGNKKYKLPQYLSENRNTLFSAIVWPSTFIVVTLFWPFYLYDKSLVYPDFIDRILTPLSNHIIHSAIIPVVLWEIALQPRTVPQTHLKYMKILLVYTLAYFGVLFYTFIEQRVWVYPIFDKIEGTIYLPILLVYAFLLVNIGYWSQWFIISRFWGHQISKENPKTK